VFIRDAENALSGGAAMKMLVCICAAMAPCGKNWISGLSRKRPETAGCGFVLTGVITLY
jgi:hypothetical protein